MPTAKLISITPNYLELIKFACSKPYGKGISNRVLENIIQSGHLSVIEHAYASFEVKCSQRVLGQLTRHRHFSFTVKSARGSKYTHMVDPKTFESVPIEHEYNARAYVGVKDIYPEEEAAYCLPQGIETELVITGDFRAWFEYLPWRMCKRAMPEHRALAEAFQKELAKAAPEIFDRQFLRCNNCKERSCSFK